MNGVYNKYSVNDKEKDNINHNDKVVNDNDECHEGDKLIKEGHDYKAVGGKFEIDPNRLIIMKAIGKGYFSDVHMGMLSLSNKQIPVAVKTTQTETNSMNAKESENVHKHQRQALRDELDIFAHLQSSPVGGHENVLKLLGAITTIRTDFSLLTEYCECGSMDHFLQAKWTNGEFVDELVLDANENEKVWKIQRDSHWGNDFQSRRDNGLITTSDLLWFALQIARGMQFLATMNVLHRDIALRNVLLTADYTLKVADFGLSRKLIESNNPYYVMKKDTALPILYTAPESLKYGRFAVTSEYWSFGVVVWELFTFAEKKPYSVELKKFEGSEKFCELLVEYLSSGHRLLISNNVPEQIKGLLSMLWHLDPKRRPSFQNCRKVIRHELMQSCPNMLVKKKVPHHSSEYSLLRIDDEDLNEEIAKSLESTPLGYDISAPPSKEIQETESHEIRVRKKVRRQIIVIVALLSAVLIGLLTVLGFTLLDTSPLERKKVTSDLNSNVTKILREEEITVGTQLDLQLFRSYEQAAIESNATAQINLAKMYQEGRGTIQSNEEAFKWYKKAAEQGNADAQGRLGRQYKEGKGVRQSYEEAVKWFRRAAEQGNGYGQFNLGYMYEDGKGVDRSYVDAVKWYIESAGNNDMYGLNHLGRMYYFGKGVNQSYEEAVKWFRNAADQGSAAAQYNLGEMYKDGLGVNQSDEESFKWFSKAAEQGWVDAQNRIESMYKNGRNVSQSDFEAVKRYKKSADQRNAKTVYYLA